MRCTLLILTALLASCGRNPGPACEQSPSLPPITPDYCNVTMPCNMALPSFMVEGATRIRAEVEFGGESMILDGDDELCLDKIYSYHGLPGDVSAPLNITVSVWSDGHPDGICYAPFTITLSPDTIDRYLTYRLIPPGYEWYHEIGLYKRDLTTYDEQCIVNSTQAGGCVNCHTSCWGDASKRFYHKRSAENGGTVFTIDGRTYTRNLKELGMQGSYPSWNPDGRSIAFACTDTHQSFYHKSRSKIEGYDLSGKLFVYDISGDREITTPYLTDSLYWHTFPAFSPDGRTLYFCRARAVDMPHEKEQLRYSIMAVDYDPDTFQLGDSARVVVAATDTSSCSFPRITPDGHFLMYTVADCGTLPMYHSESDLRLLDLTTDRELDISHINSEWADSYHTFSSNSRWVVFSSRRIDGRYTRLFFAHIDEKGRVSKPFLLPQRSPLHNIMRMDSYNVPDLIESKE